MSSLIYQNTYDSETSNSKIVKEKLQAQKVLYKSKDVQLIEDYFGIYHGEGKEYTHVKRYTWKNYNKVSVQVITYGATITSIKFPNSKGIEDDILLGFDNLEGYLLNDQLMFGSTIGRVSNTVELGTFVIDGKQFFLSKNSERDHKDGGFKGFNKVLWEPYVTGTQLILSYTSLNKEEGYPGDLMVRITYELTGDSEFKVDMEALTTRPTIVDLSQLLYFNLGGQWSGPEELYKHVVTINANCFTLTSEEDGLPTGDIMNVIYSKFDFQSPKILKYELMNDNGIDQNFCINRGKSQDLCFVARVLHPPSGRILEIYSNQYGVHLSTANHLGLGVLDIPPTDECPQKYTGSLENQLDLIKKLYEHMKSTMDTDFDFCQLRELIRKFKMKYVPSKPPSSLDTEASVDKFSSGSKIQMKRSDIVLSRKQKSYLEDMEGLIGEIESETDYREFGKVLRDIITQAEIEDVEEEEDDEMQENKIEPSVEGIYYMNIDNPKLYSVRNSLVGGPIKEVTYKIKNTDSRIHGKGDAIYKKHCALSLKTQNYPNAIHHPNFPPCILKPGEVYRHSVVYKFMLKDGHPRNWIKRNFPENGKRK